MGFKIENIQTKEKVCRQSCIKCAYACKRKLLYQYIWGITLRGYEVRESADLGTIYHKLQQVGPGKEQEAKNWISQLQQDLVKRADAGEDIDGGMIRRANMLTMLYKKAEAMAHISWARYPQPEYLKTIGTEVKHRMVLPEFGELILEGTIDKLLLELSKEAGLIDGKAVWIRDYKSSGRSLATIFGGATFSVQARVYRLLTKDYLRRQDISAACLGSNMPVRGFILDGILKPGIKLCGKDEKTAIKESISVEEAYLRRVKEWYATYEEKNEGAKALDSTAIIFTEPEMPGELIAAFQMMQYFFSLPAIPENFDRDITRMACYQYERQCKYHLLCDTPPQYWDAQGLFDTKYKIEEKSNVEDKSDGEF